MRACAITACLALATLVGASAPLACTATVLNPEPAAMEGAVAPVPTGPAVEASPPVPAEGIATAAAPAATSAPAGSAPRTAADCRELATEITNEPPDGGLVMNNAMTSGDAGASDRLAPLMSLMRSKRDAFRCCFDLWGKDNPGKSGKIALSLALEPNGTLTTAEVDAKQSDVSAEVVTSCVVAAAKAITYPPSPSGKATRYVHLFEFRVKEAP
jgi:hypothetical protein